MPKSPETNISYMCPECGKKFRVPKRHTRAPKELRGQTWRCPHCRQPIVLLAFDRHAQPETPVADERPVGRDTTVTHFWSSFAVVFVVTACVVLAIAYGAGLFDSVSNEAVRLDLVSGPLANHIMPLEQELEQDNSLILNERNTRWIQQIRSMALLAGFDYSESHLGPCLESNAEVIFDRPDALYGVWIGPRTTRANIYKRKTDDFVEIRRNLELLATLAASMLDEASSRRLKYVTSRAKYTQLFGDAMRGKEVEGDFECGSLNCRFYNATVTTSYPLGMPSFEFTWIDE